MTSSLSFYCRPSKMDKRGLAPIEASIIINGKRLFCNLPRKERPADFKRALSQRRANDIKDYLEEVRGKFNGYQTELLQNNLPITAATLKTCFQNGGVRSYTIGDLFTDYLSLLSKRVGIDLTRGAYRKYELTKELFLKHIDKDLEITSLTPAVIQDYYITLQKTYKPNSAASYIAKTKTFIQHGIDNGHIRINPFQGLKVHRERKAIDYLTDDEIERLRTARIDNESLNNVRDAFLLQIYSGLSYIDLEHLREEDIREENGTWYIQKRRVKTGVTYTAVILPEGVEVLRRHNYRMRVISNQKMNCWLKQVMVLAGIDHPLVTHLGRKTYGHILLNKGVRLETVAKSLGHSNPRTTARYYAEVSPDTIIKEVTQAFK